jgi:hypothetical protein
MPSCASQHYSNVHEHDPDKNPGTNTPEINHTLLSKSRIGVSDNSRIFNRSGGNNISKNSIPEQVFNLNRSDRVSSIKSGVLTSTSDVSDESRERPLKFNSDLVKATANETKFDDRRDIANQDVKQCQNCAEEERMEMPGRGKRSVVLLPGTPIHVETAVFIDKDLYQHMALNFPDDTERELVRVVLAMINAVSTEHENTSKGKGTVVPVFN